MILHVINKPESYDPAFCGEDDSVVLIENGIYLKLERKTYVVKADLEARGVQPETHQTLIDYDGFVELCCQHDKVITW